MSSPDRSSNEKSPEKTAVRKMVVVLSSPEPKEEKGDSRAIELPEMPDGPAEAVTMGR